MLAADARAELLSHPLYAELSGLAQLRVFMGWHVFAVWDFMSLAKRLQRELSCVELPWLPPADARAGRFVNEVVLAEESDLDLEGRPASHLELYLQAMDEVGAPRGPIERLLSELRQGAAPEVALAAAEAPEFVRAFVRETLRWANEGSLAEVLGVFLYSREDPIPAMFSRVLAALPAGLPRLRHYLERHIELDADEHAPAARAALERAGGATPAVEAAVESAIRARIALWDGIRAGLVAL